MRRLGNAFLLGVLSLVAVNATAFDETGHFYTAYALAMTIRPNNAPKDQLLIAFCAQLPDMSSDLDAVTVYSRTITRNPWAWVRWAATEYTDADAVRRMVTVQQLLHALTNGSSAAVENVADKNLELLHKGLEATGKPNRSAELCAIGFGLHFLGDSVAHQRLDDATRMYATGRGHASDIHYPDRVLCGALADPPRPLNHCKFDGPRFGKWKDTLWSHAAKQIDPDDAKVDPKPREDLVVAVAALGASATDGNDLNESQIAAALSGNTKVDLYSKFIGDQHSDRPCDEVLAKAIQGLPDLGAFSGLKCAAVWSVYAKAIKQAYADPLSAGARTEVDRDFSQVYVDNPLD